MINREFKYLVVGGLALTMVMSVLCFFIGARAYLFCAVMGILLTALFAFSTWKRYQALGRLNEYLSFVLAGNYDMQLSENTEGELSVLKNNLYKVTVLLRTQNEHLKSDKVALADALADISHQLKTPLTSMVMMVDLLKEENDFAKRRQFLDITRNQLDKMQWLILNLLKISKLDAGTVELKKESVSVKEVLKESLKPFLLTMDLRGISVEKEDRDFLFYGDKNWTTEALSNIIKNCVEHMGEGGKLSVQVKETNLYGELIISDTGCGIAAEELPHIFERFYHGKNASPESVGIGLALAKAILERQRVSIHAESQTGIGTRFVLRFYKAIV